MLSARAGAVLGVLVVLVAILAIPVKEWITQRTRIATLEEELASRGQQVADLEAAKLRWADPAYIEAQARVRLQFVRPGEVGYVVLADDAPADRSADSNRPMAPAPKGWPWWNAVWSTMEQSADPTSGRPPDAAAPAHDYRAEQP